MFIGMYIYLCIGHPINQALAFRGTLTIYTVLIICISIFLF